MCVGILCPCPSVRSSLFLEPGTGGALHKYCLPASRPRWALRGYQHESSHPFHFLQKQFHFIHYIKYHIFFSSRCHFSILLYLQVGATDSHREGGWEGDTSRELGQLTCQYLPGQGGGGGGSSADGLGIMEPSKLITVTNDFLRK